MNCKACGAEIKSKKEPCPGCGHKEKSKVGCILLIVIPAILLVIALVVGILLLGVGAIGAGILLTAPKQAEVVQLPTTTVPITDDPIQEVVPETEATAEPTVAPTEVPTTAPTQPPVVHTYNEVPYRITVEHPGFPIYYGPSYESGISQYFEEAGIYTIVEEYWSEDDQLWGRLKSGVGWVNLTWLDEIQ